MINKLNITYIGIARTPSPAIGEHVMAVASFENAEKFGHVFHISDNDAHYGPFGKHCLSDNDYNCIIMNPSPQNIPYPMAVFSSLTIRKCFFHSRSFLIPL